MPRIGLVLIQLLVIVLAQSGSDDELGSSWSWEDDEFVDEHQQQLIDEILMQDEPIHANNQTSSNNSSFDLIYAYQPLIFYLQDLSSKDRERLKSYLTHQTYEKLKNEIDNRANVLSYDFVDNYTMVESNYTQIDNSTMHIVQGYHNASIYNAIRSVFLKQLRPFLPIMDQIAIMQYFAQRKEAEYERMSLWSRFWHNFNKWMYGSHENLDCTASEPACIRCAFESLELDERIDMENAASENEFDRVDEIVRQKLIDNGRDREFNEWLRRNEPPLALRWLLDERTNVEEEALQRLRDNGVITSLKYYYRAVIESRSTEDQESIRQFFEKVNDTFARCFDPLRGKFEEQF